MATPQQKELYAHAIAHGASKTDAAKSAGFDNKWAGKQGYRMSMDVETTALVKQKIGSRLDKSKGSTAALERSVRKTEQLLARVEQRLEDKPCATLDQATIGELVQLTGQLETIRKLNYESLERALALQEKYGWGKPTQTDEHKVAAATDRAWYRLGRWSVYREQRRAAQDKG